MENFEIEMKNLGKLKWKLMETIMEHMLNGIYSDFGNYQSVSIW